MSSDWNARQYLRFGDERTRPAADLIDRIRLTDIDSIVDLGCGPGNSTALLQQNWPLARLIAVDSSPEMIATAASRLTDVEWVSADASKWRPESPVQLVFSNAALQWMRDHKKLLLHLASYITVGGVLAFQVPSRSYARIRELMIEVASEAAWSDRMQDARQALTMHHPEFYYDVLASLAAHLDIWETEYFHILESREAIIDWMSSTGLRPFLQALNDDEERAQFLTRLRMRIRDAYDERVDGRVLFPFRRCFVIAYR